MTQPIIECVPNFSEGRDAAVIEDITGAIAAVPGAWLLDVDPGKATNRTVVTLVGAPDAVLDAAVAGAKRAAELIDMRKHRGEHPRFGALDVCPLVPVAGISMAETVVLARRLAERLAEEVGLTVYCYEQAAFREERRNLAQVREGEYEALAARLARPEHKPDFGPAAFNAKSGATAVGARDFLVAYNVNLNTTSTRRANAIAFDVREKGRERLDPKTMKPVRDAQGDAIWDPGSLRAVKGIGWFIEELGIAQVSLNLTDIGVTPVHVAFDEVCRRAEARGVRVTGSELVGVIPMRAMLDAGRYFLQKQQRSLGVSDAELIKIAIKSLGLNDLYPFEPEKKIVELAIAARQGSPARRLVDRTLQGFVEETASESPAPGGGSVAAALGALGAALGTMVANLSAHKRGWDARWEEFSGWAERGKAHSVRLLELVDEDTRAFNAVMDCFGMPKGTETEKAERKRAIERATLNAIQVPLSVMREALAAMEVIGKMAEIGNPASVSDAGVGALCARSAVMGAHLNVKINASGVSDKATLGPLLSEALEIERRACEAERAILAAVEAKL
ncbi:MAG: glutamate formimidoyltransferase [Polyangiaceae bacterium]|nr:glutamate formimidoyltransferase [Polyangiaceae bacterium]MCE7891679.1 glutamate formimidoyltransferase [Sorangiineae bacterium PRO1]MCL4752138.1 glutamate formimidoyltransferase [Myxococcales bacterium]